MEEKKDTEKVIDLFAIFATLKQRRKTFYKVWTVVFLLSSVWVFSKQRYYACEVKLAPELMGSTSTSSLASLASSFGMNISNLGGRDAIHPLIYPDLINSPEFIVGLLNIQVETFDGDVQTDYYTYLKNHQKKNKITGPITDVFSKLFAKEDTLAKADIINPFNMNKKDHMLVDRISKNIKCSVDRKNYVVSIKVTDQDKLVCALMADSIREHLQDFIYEYRTKKARQDEARFKLLADSARIAYETALLGYSRFKDSHQYVHLLLDSEEGERLKKDVDIKFSTYNAFNSQYTAAKAKVQEETPSFSILQSATVPYKPAGPRRLLIVAFCLIVSTLITIVCVFERKYVQKSSII